MIASCSTRRGGGRKQKMVKNMKKEMKNENRDNVAAIGIGAMIVFIALILVAAVAAAVIIQTAEKLQQNAQTTGEQTTDLMAGRITVLSVVIVTGADLYVTFELAPGSDALVPSDVEFQIICPGGTAGFEAGDFGTSAGAAVTQAARILGGTADATSLDPASAYSVILNPTGDCAPDPNALDTMVIQAGSGGFTYELLQYGGSVDAGEVVV